MAIPSLPPSKSLPLSLQNATFAPVLAPSLALNRVECESLLPQSNPVSSPPHVARKTKGNASYKHRSSLDINDEVMVGGRGCHTVQVSEKVREIANSKSVREAMGVKTGSKPAANRVRQKTGQK